MRHRSRVIGAATAAVLLTVSGCGDDSGNEGSQNLSDPEAFEPAAKQDMLPIVAGIGNGLQRLFVALAGGPADGVTITPTQTGGLATIQVDFDGNGSREGAINGSFAGDISSGATISITSVTGDDPS